jgi:hypothetical protein
LPQKLGAIVALSDGEFGYSLDDPYIHLALAEGIRRGEYGINPGEFASPSSSVLWPFLLVPFQTTALAQIAPLLINLLATAGAVLALQQVLQRVARPSTRLEALMRAGGITLLSACLNLVPLALTGMEHSLQVLVVLTASRPRRGAPGATSPKRWPV